MSAAVDDWAEHFQVGEDIVEQLQYQVQHIVQAERYPQPSSQLQAYLDRIRPPRNYTAMPVDGNTRCRAMQPEPAYSLSQFHHLALNMTDYAIDPAMRPQHAAAIMGRVSQVAP